MKTKIILAFLSLGKTESIDCDLSGTALFTQNANGKYSFGPDYKIKLGLKNKASGEKLQNKGTLDKKNATFKHKKDGPFSDGWIVCENNAYSMFHLRCFKDGTFDINQVAGNDAPLPSCDPIGCDPADLGPFNSRLYTKQDGCKVGYHENSVGKKLEITGNKCFRFCANETVKSKTIIHCLCDVNSGSATFGTCGYKIKKGGFIPWTSLKANGEPYIETESCQVDEVPEWTNWSSWSECNVDCGQGVKERTRECKSGETPSTDCGGKASQTKSCTGPNGSTCSVAGCSSDMPLSVKETKKGLTANDISWQCTDGNNKESICTKVCPQGFWMKGTAESTTCQCNGDDCIWSSTSDCEPGLCNLNSGAVKNNWPEGYICQDPNGMKLDLDNLSTPMKVHVGSSCMLECPSEHHLYEKKDKHGSKATCICDKEWGCFFDFKKLAQCNVIGTCSETQEEIFDLFMKADAFPYNSNTNADISLFADIECDDRYPENHPNPLLAGNVKLNTSCYVKCKDGAKFHDNHHVKPEGGIIKMTCTHQEEKYSELQVMFDLIQLVVSTPKTSDGYSCDGWCHWLPLCVPAS